MISNFLTEEAFDNQQDKNFSNILFLCAWVDDTLVSLVAR